MCLPSFSNDILLFLHRVQPDDSQILGDGDETLELQAGNVHLAEVDELEQVLHLARLNVLHEDDLVLISGMVKKAVSRLGSGGEDT